MSSVTPYSSGLTFDFTSQIDKFDTSPTPNDIKVNMQTYLAKEKSLVSSRIGYKWGGLNRKGAYSLIPDFGSEGRGSLEKGNLTDTGQNRAVRVFDIR